MVVEIFNANVTYSVKQLTADCVAETPVHNGFNVDNDYNIRFRTVYKVAYRCLSFAIVVAFLQRCYLGGN